DGIRDDLVTGVQTCALPIFRKDRFGDIQRGGRLIVWDRETVMCDSHALDGTTSEDIFYRHYEISDEDELRQRLEELAEAILASRSEERRVGKEWRDMEA